MIADDVFPVEDCIADRDCRPDANQHEEDSVEENSTCSPIGRGMLFQLKMNNNAFSLPTKNGDIIEN